MSLAVLPYVSFIIAGLIEAADAIATANIADAVTMENAIAIIVVCFDSTLSGNQSASRYLVHRTVIML